MIETNVVVRLWRPQERPLTDKEIADAVRILYNELAPVTPAMLEAASREATTVSDKHPEVSDDELLSAIWRAMLKAKLGAPT